MRYLDSGMFYLWETTSQLSMKSLTGARNWAFTRLCQGQREVFSLTSPRPSNLQDTGYHCGKLTAWKVSLEAGKKEECLMKSLIFNLHFVF